MLLPQIASSDPGTHAACVALGAAVSQDCARDSSSTARLYRYYGQAIHKIQQDLTKLATDPTCLVSMCLLLGMTDLLMKRPTEALSHLQGALTLLRDRRRIVAETNPDPAEALETTKEFELLDVIDVVGTTLDICGLAFALDVAPRLPKLKNVNAGLGSDLQITFNSEIDILKVLHACFTFLNGASGYKYTPARFRPLNIGIEQGRHIANMFATLRSLDSTLTESNDQRKLRSIVLRAQCYSCLIWLYAILDPRECVYDAYTPIFSAILGHAEEFMDHESFSTRSMSPVFTADLGIVQPIWLTAKKSRDVQVRNKALELLQKSGRDAPFEGRVLAVIARRTAELEASPVDSTRADGETLSNITPEHRRIVDCGPDLVHQVPAGASSVVAFFKRCVSIQNLMAEESPNGHKKESHWSVWREKISIES